MCHCSNHQQQQSKSDLFIFQSLLLVFACSSLLPWQPASLALLASSFYLLCLPYSRNDSQFWTQTDKQFLCLSLPRQDTQSTGVFPDDSGSTLMDDTSSQWSAAADTEEERRSALEKSMYVFHQWEDPFVHITHPSQFTSQNCCHARSWQMCLMLECSCKLSSNHKGC